MDLRHPELPLRIGGVDGTYPLEGAHNGKPDRNNTSALVVADCAYRVLSMPGTPVQCPQDEG